MQKPIFLLFGPIQLCRQYARENQIALEGYKAINKDTDYLGYKNVSLVRVGPFNDHYYELYLAARAYFTDRGELLEHSECCNAPVKPSKALKNNRVLCMECGKPTNIKDLWK